MLVPLRCTQIAYVRSSLQQLQHASAVVCPPRIAPLVDKVEKKGADIVGRRMQGRLAVGETVELRQRLDIGLDRSRLALRNHEMLRERFAKSCGT